MPRSIALVLAALLALATGCVTTTERLNLPPLETVESVELERYLGTWFEVASFPQSFQRNCTATTATYALQDDGEIEVTNRCRKGSPDGTEDEAIGRARVVDTTTNAKLEVSFFGDFWGDYWIIELGDDYEYAVVGHPGRDYLWILAREVPMDPALYDGIVERLQAVGYETEKLVVTEH